MKPQLADNWLEGKQVLPAWQQPKYDGVRGLYLTNQFTGRSLKPFKNKALTEFWSNRDFCFLDGELILPGTDGIEGRQCSLVTGMTNSPKCEDIPDLIAFDLLAPDLIAKGATYEDRYWELALQVDHLQAIYGTSKIRLMPYQPVFTMEQVEAQDGVYLDMGLEGSILRNHKAQYKEGRPSSKTQELMRIKRFIDFEFIIDGFVEALENTNEAKTNELGRTERSTAKGGLVAKGMVGAIQGRIHGNVTHGGKLLFPDGMPILVGPGQLTHKERVQWWQERNGPNSKLGKIGKCATFPHQVKSKPRMPIFKTLRSEEDMS